jgi:hypothetical protein
MDTRFWGPPGWVFFQTLAATTTLGSARNKFISRFFAILPFVLPCKYCRASLTGYIDEHPLTDEVMASNDTFLRWMYTIHNCVNDKLRGQGLLTEPNPTYVEALDHIHTTIAKNTTSGIRLPGWDFLYAIAYNLPSPDVATDIECMDIEDEVHMRDLNVHHAVPFAERMDRLREFWTILPFILPSTDAGYRWMERATELDLDEALDGCNSHAMMAWLYEINKAVEREAGMTESFDDLYTRVSGFASKCSTQTRGKTCRRATRGGRVTRRRKHAKRQ